MIDNVTIKTPIKNRAWLLNQFDWAHTTLSKSNKIISSSTYLDNLRLTLKGNNLSISNSLHKYYKGNNYSSFSYDEFEDSIAKLSDAIQTDLTKALIPKFEFGISFPVENIPIYYLNQIEAYKPKSIVPLDSSNRRSNLYYDSERLRLKIYDKTKEANLFSNMIRLEITRKSSSKYLNHIQTVEDILNQNNYINLKNELLNHFNKLQFKESYHLDNSLNSNDVYKLLALQNTSPAEVFNTLKQTQEQKTYEYQKANLNKLINSSILPNSNKNYLSSVISHNLALL